jgi:general secretion pathway protein G
MQYNVYLIVLIIAAILGITFMAEVQEQNNVSDYDKVGMTKVLMYRYIDFMGYYKYNFGKFPDNTQGINALNTLPDPIPTPNGTEILIYSTGKERFRTTDAWDNKFIYKLISPSSFTITSLGADGKEGGTGENADIVVNSL